MTTRRQLKWKARHWLRHVVPVRRYAGRRLDAYWLSTGRCGTRLIARMLATASNSSSHHELGLIREAIKQVDRAYHRDPAAFWSLRLEQFPYALGKFRENFKYPGEVFTELSCYNTPYTYMLWDYYRRTGRRLKLVHLIREPVSCCRSILKAERLEDQGNAFKRRFPSTIQGTSSAELAADVWVRINRFAQEVIQRINDPSVTRVVRVEDLNVEGFRELFDFLELRGFDAARVEQLLNDKSNDVRHSHVANPAFRTRHASPEELETVRRLTAPLARQFGFDPQSTAVAPAP